MNIKPKIGATPRPLLPVEDDERHRGDADGFLTRNRDALDASIRRSRKQIAEGEISSKTIEDIITEGRRKHTAD